jgi:hypothetical protein
MAAPSDITVDKRQIDVSFTALTLAAELRGAPITSYTVQYKKTADASWTDITNANPTLVSITSLTTATEYRVRVIANNRHGASTPSTELVRTTLTDVPDAPTNVQTSLTGDSLGIIVSWNDGASNNGLAVTKYRIWIQ